ncbi:hypothetical protein Ahy_A06g028169 [Arachis hypogaea]|uniref:Transposase MuDR plant domain-containing protein n=1 Tax=Arachis hypogaea TaxID=3818 RepID=A0A445CQK4_ARAHY|nr:hypothetical protein Ahy_A06g028169 [Arachis hypogaea]
MSDRVLLKVYYFGQILLQTYEGVTFVCENSLDIVIPFTISFEELKGVICEKIHSERARRISCILYRYPIQVFGEFIQFQTKYVTDEASMQDMFSMYIENWSQLSFIELYVEFEQSEADQNILQEDYNSDNKEEFESNYEFVGPDGDDVQSDGAMAPDVSDVATALANDVPFEEPSFMRVLDLEAMHVPKFPDYISAEIPFVADGEFAVGMEFSSREAVIKAIKEYTIRRSVDYRVYESEPLTFYAKCTQYGSGCDWLIRVSMISRKYYWVIKRYNDSHTCTRATISQDHSRLDSTTISEAIRPLVEAPVPHCHHPHPDYSHPYPHYPHPYPDYPHPYPDYPYQCLDPQDSTSSSGPHILTGTSTCKFSMDAVKAWKAQKECSYTCLSNTSPNLNDSVL